MHLTKPVLNALLIGCCILLGGCDAVQQQLGLLQKQVEEQRVDESLLPPITVTFGPAKKWVSAAIRLTQTVNQNPNELSDENLSELFPGLDVNRPCGAAIYFSDGGSLEPLVLIPITDYEKLLNKIATMVPLQRAAASSFDFLGLRCKIMQRGDYAAVVLNLKTMDRIPDDVNRVLGQVDEPHDMALEIHGSRFPAGCNGELLKRLERWLPCKSLEAITTAERLIVGISFSDTQSVPFELKLDSAKTVNAEVIAELTEWISEQVGVEVTSQLAANTIQWQFKLEDGVVREQIKLAQSSVTEALESRKSAFSHLAAMQKYADTAPVFPTSFGGGASPRRS